MEYCPYCPFVFINLYFYFQQPNLFSYEEQPISVKSCIVDIAHSYTKKKNVFRMKTYNGSEYLFQADDHEEMIAWIEVIKLNSNPDEDVCLIMYKTVLSFYDLDTKAFENTLCEK